MCGEFERECEIKAAGIEGWGEEGFVERGLPGAPASSDLGSSRIRRRDQLGGHGGQSRTMEVNPGRRSIQDHGGQSSLVLRLGGGEARSCRNPSLHPIPSFPEKRWLSCCSKGEAVGSFRAGEGVIQAWCPMKQALEGTQASFGQLAALVGGGGLHPGWHSQLAGVWLQARWPSQG